MKCATLTTTYTCNSATGTTCTKVTVSIPVVNANTTCVAADYVLLLQPEYQAMVTATTTAQTTATAASTAASGASTGNTTQDGLIAALTSQLNSANAAIVSLQGGGGGGASSVPNPDIIAAEGIIFGATLVAMASIYGLKKILSLLMPSGVGHE